MSLANAISILIGQTEWLKSQTEPKLWQRRHIAAYETILASLESAYPDDLDLGEDRYHEHRDRRAARDGSNLETID